MKKLLTMIGAAAETIFAAQDWIAAQDWTHEDEPSPVQVALKWLRKPSQGDTAN